jgi:hypothetical protein
MSKTKKEEAKKEISAQDAFKIENPLENAPSAPRSDNHA